MAVAAPAEFSKLRAALRLSVVTQWSWKWHQLISEEKIKMAVTQCPLKHSKLQYTFNVKLNRPYFLRRNWWINWV